jgi:hypothetical protein
MAWSIVHGIAKLAISGNLPPYTSKQVLDFTQYASQAFVRGMGFLKEFRIQKSEVQVRELITDRNRLVRFER